MSCFWFFPHDALQTVSNTACPIPLSFWINWGIYYNLWTIWESQAPVCLTWHVIEMTHWQNKWSRRIPVQIWAISSFFFGSRYVWLLKKFMSFMAHEETTFMLNLSSQGATLNFIAWKKLFVFIATWLHTDKCFFQIFSMVNNLLQTERFINKRCKVCFVFIIIIIIILI